MKISKIILISLFIISCENSTNSDDGWVYLSDGETFNNWHTYLSDSVVGWTIEEGAFVLNPGIGSSNNGLVSNKSYTNFKLSLEWKIEKGGNSGIFWGVNENEKFSVPYLTAAEIQVIDDDVYDKNEKKNHLHMNGALYDMVPPSILAANPTGKWNKYLIEINYNKNYDKCYTYGKANDYECSNLIKSDKDASRTKVIEIFPYISSKISRKKDSNKADSILIAKYFEETQNLSF